ncbi:Cupin domain-containing protein [Anaerovirgula multivorans]|uniref:Cupin domain-containing protein n=1 Tax=Anaerovirgula multivorans TaxID=312168 RepID=A0A239JPJ0_9FIRM|nr:cupin domain-containing protein [Anaerovirgula multivorans]SNT07338.1 Cupin domain-containing protein [Anaerovirgula multivorans]
MLYKRGKEIEVMPLENVMGGKGIVMMQRLLDAPKEMLGKGRAYVKHTLNPGVSIGIHKHEKEMESMFIVSGKAIHRINGETQSLEAGDMIAAMPGDTHGIACEGNEPLVIIAQVLYE